MSMQRMTISFPTYLYDYLIKLVPSRRISSFVTEAVEKEILKTEEEPVAGFIAMRQKLPKLRNEDIFKAIKKGRL